MSTPLVTEADGYGFTLTRFAGGVQRGRCYQVNVGEHFIQLTAWEALQLVAAIVKDQNDIATGRARA